jgi:hypothetical protein
MVAQFHDIAHLSGIYRKSMETPEATKLPEGNI